MANELPRSQSPNQDQNFSSNAVNFPKFKMLTLDQALGGLPGDEGYIGLGFLSSIEQGFQTHRSHSIPAYSVSS